MSNCRIRWIILMSVVLLPWTSVLKADSSYDGLFRKGNQYYQNGDVALARDAYETIIKQGLSNAAVFYNLGNCYMKLGDPGRAILNYRKAERLDYGDRDIRTNLEIARSLVAGSESVAGAGGVGNWLLRIASSAGATTLTIATFVTWWLTAALFVSGSTSRFRRTRRRMFRATAGALFAFVVSAVLLAVLIGDREFTDHAVAIDQPVIARNGPGDHFTEVFEQRPGYEMIVHRKQNGWVEITLSNGYTAWVPAKSVEWI
ncbi:tetratricopeptide repeat protein [bacterium]|nr:tetratricopeptide repeat protein [candidate division CSSED10-310 bacterium]